MLVFLATDTMGFGGLLLADALLRVRAGTWPDPAARYDRPLAAALTFLLLFSGATMTAAVITARQGRSLAARILMGVTALAGLLFATGQALEFQALATARHVGLTADPAAALFYVITGYHGLHVLVGVAALTAIALGVGGGRGRGGGGDGRPRAALSDGAAVPSSEAAPDGDDTVSGIEVVSLYWQFVDIVWIVIFTALYLLPPVTHG
jgi:heme/copper-type cytochrome/quinol oxidase subunit 3